MTFLVPISSLSPISLSVHTLLFDIHTTKRARIPKISVEYQSEMVIDATAAGI